MLNGVRIGVAVKLNELVLELAGAKPLYINGIEVTQAIQYYDSGQHLTDPADRRADNAVRLVAFKPAYVRVYVRGGSAPVYNVSGTLQVQRRRLGFLYDTVQTLTPIPDGPSWLGVPGTVRAQTSLAYNTERSDLRRSLNFYLSGDLMMGWLRLIVRIQAGELSDQTELDLDVTLRQTLRVAGILVSYSGPPSSTSPPGTPNINLAAPSLQDLRPTSAFARNALPVESAGRYRNAGSLPWTRPLDDPVTAGFCSTNWNDLLTALQTPRTNDGNRQDWVYYGLLPSGIPVGGLIGCGGPAGTSAGRAGTNLQDQQALAHEVCHQLGFTHAPCGAVGTTADPNYPTYEPYGAASIGEFGLNVSTGQIIRPTVARDLMSYCPPQWLSLYHYRRLLREATPALDPTLVGLDEPIWAYPEVELWPERWLPDPPQEGSIRRLAAPNPEPLVSLIGVVRSAREVEVRSVARVVAQRELVGAQPTDLRAELVDAEGRVLADGPVQRLLMSGGGCGCAGGDSGRPPFAFQAFLPDVAPGAALRIRRDDEEVWGRTAPADPPAISSFEVRARPQRGLSVRWSARVSDQAEPEAWMQWSSDNGREWYGLTVGLPRRRAEVPFNGLPAGELLLRLLVHDGFFTAVSAPVRVEIPGRPPSIGIVHPYDGGTLAAEGPLRLWGEVIDAAGQPLESVEARWLLDGEEVAQGLDAFGAAPAAGEHRCTLIVTVDGQTLRESVRFRTLAIPRADHEPSG
jgi:hypothetical protein